jgi:hypothetical protein
MGWWSIRILLKNHWVRKAQIYMKVFFYILQIQIHKYHGPQGSDGARKEKTILHTFIWGEIFSRTSKPISIKLNANYPCMRGIKIYSNKGSSKGR